MAGLAVRFSKAPGDAALEGDWCALERAGERSFFQSSFWLRAMLETAPKNIIAARIFDGEKIIAMTLLWPVTERRHGAFSVRQLRVNEIGADARDCAQGEFTTLIAEAGAEEKAWAALIEALLAPDTPGAPQWSEIILTNALARSEAMIAEIAETKNLRIHRRAEAGSAFVDLEALRKDGVADLEAYLTKLGRSTRAQIQRSLKLYSERGALSFERARTLEEAEDWFGAAAAWQSEKWRARGKKGILDAPFTMRFQQALIRGAFEAGGVELIRASAGGEPFAYLQNYIDRGAVLFNLAGFRVEANKHLKPGLVAHALAIEDHLKSGMCRYDFLAGDDRYKFNLGRKGPDFSSFAIQKKTAGLEAEHMLRRLKNRFR
ncbi:MAG: GNAT family N-acetyltransferase [Parvularculaceae bacterium]